MKRNKLLLTAALAGVVVVLGGGYAAYDYYAGNHVTIEQVIPVNGQAAASTPGSTIQSDKLNGTWNIQKETSNVYLSVTTSKETVNISMKGVKGSWVVNLEDASKMTGEGIIDLNTLDSGNATRDGHIKGDKFLNIASQAEATFKVKSIENMPKTWSDGQAMPINLKGTLTVKGVSKDVTFASQALYDQGALKLSGTTKVTFSDFGMTNPHAVVLETENDLAVRLELTLNKA
jgi:polyisoprenoid-binding protein YceI